MRNTQSYAIAKEAPQGALKVRLATLARATKENAAAALVALSLGLLWAGPALVVVVCTR